ncbi:hypothetical protein NFI96_007667 [Prochilodus magdalenae]|nr:hypothetical protein NFI96_007667 [Prochilodus magdalenae]
MVMEQLRIGSLNINGGRDRMKRAMVSESFKQKKLDVLFLQETHSDSDNEVEWMTWWEGECFLSHGTNTTAGVAVLFDRRLALCDTHVTELEQGRILLISSRIRSTEFLFVNVYAHNNGGERARLFLTLQTALQRVTDDPVVVMGGDWNCTLDPTVDRTGEEPHPQSAMVLGGVVRQCGLVDMWRDSNQLVRQYTWVRVSGARISAARLDRFYVSSAHRNRFLKTGIHPSGFSDHHLISVDFITPSTQREGSYWRFDLRLLQDEGFSALFRTFWEEWRLRKAEFKSLVSWWEVGKTQIRVFSQQYRAHSADMVSDTLCGLEAEVRLLERELVDSGNIGVSGQLDRRRKALSSFLHEHSKAALTRHRFSTINDMDSPSAFFFNLPKTARPQNRMLHLRSADGRVTTVPAEMRTLATDFYKGLYAPVECDPSCRDELLCDLPRITGEQVDLLEAVLELQELTTAAQEQTSGRAPGIDGLPAEFYKHFWGTIGEDLFAVFKCCFSEGRLPVSSSRAVLSLLPKAGDLGLLKNWRPVALLCSDYKILAKCLSNRLKSCMHSIVHDNHRTIMDIPPLVRDVIDLCGMDSLDIGLLTLDQEKAFDRVDHIYLFKTLQAFGFKSGFISWLSILYSEASFLLKVGGGLSAPFKMGRGIRQGCPLSGALYSLAIEPLLHRLRAELQGFSMRGLQERVALSAYADDITVFLKSQADVHALLRVLGLYMGASSARVNWAKCESFLLGQWERTGPPFLPAGLQWGREGLKYLGVFLGTPLFQKKNWDGVVEKVCAKLSKWTWVLPQLSYRGRVLVANNLVASMLWHRLAVLEPPASLIKDIQMRIVNFFWSGQHWIPAPALYLPLQEGGQGLIDLSSRVKAFRLQTVQRLIHGKS